MKELVEYIVKALVECPDKVEVIETAGESISVIEIRVDPSDLGKVIGKEGRMANAIRTVVKSAAMKQGKKATIEILTEDSEKGR